MLPPIINDTTEIDTWTESGVHRFFESFDITGDNDHWIWNGPTVMTGYPAFNTVTVEGQYLNNLSPAKIMWAAVNGMPDTNYRVLRTDDFDNKLCINPAHRRMVKAKARTTMGTTSPQKVEPVKPKADASWKESAKNYLKSM